MRYEYSATGGMRFRRGRKAMAVVIFISLVIFGGIGGFIFWDMQRSQSEEVSGASVTVQQQEDLEAQKQKAVDEPLFTFKLPPDWKEIDRRNTNSEQSITWQAKKKKADNRWLKLYIDVIPPDTAVNRLLPIDVSGNKLTYRQISDNCKNFTTVDENDNVPQPSKWQGVDFICDVPGFVQNKIGTGTEGAVNSTSVTGPTKGTHRYFFVYTDHNIQPEYRILHNVITSFEAK